MSDWTWPAGLSRAMAYQPYRARRITPARRKIAAAAENIFSGLYRAVIRSTFAPCTRTYLPTDE